MRLFFTLILVQLSYNFCLSQTYSNLVSDTTIQEFIKWKFYIDTFRNDNISKEYFTFSSAIMKWLPIELKWDSSVSITQNNGRCIFNNGNKWLDTILTIKDKEFIINQSKSYKTSTWLIKPQTSSKANKEYEYYFTLPLFSLDKQYALLKELYYCGEDCGEERIMLYKHTEENGWILYTGLMGGVF